MSKLTKYVLLVVACIVVPAAVVWDYLPAVLDKYPQLLGWYMLNPITPIIELFRAAYLGVPGYSYRYSLLSVGVTAVVFLLGVCITLVYVVIVATWGTLEFATVLGNYIAICATAMAFISIGVFISSLTQNQLVAAIVTVAVFLGLYLLDYSYSLMNATWAENLIYYFSMFRRYNDFTQGIFSFADLIFYLSVAGVFVFLTVRMLERKRWS